MIKIDEKYVIDTYSNRKWLRHTECRYIDGRGFGLCYPWPSGVSKQCGVCFEDVPLEVCKKFEFIIGGKNV